MDIDDPAPKSRDETGGDELHISGEDDEADPPFFEPVRHRLIARIPARMGARFKHD